MSFKNNPHPHLLHGSSHLPRPQSASLPSCHDTAKLGSGDISIAVLVEHFECFNNILFTVPSASISLIISCNPASVALSDRMTVTVLPSSFIVIVALDLGLFWF